MKCKYCNSEIAGKKVYCDDKCRMAFNRINPNSQPEHEPEHYATRTNPDTLNYGKPMKAHQLERAGLKANRVPIPGDHDYKGACVKQDGEWKVA